MSKPVYTIHRCAQAPAAVASLADPAWRQAEVVQVKWVADKSRGTIPTVFGRVLHDNANLYGLYQVRDFARIATHTEYNSSVCQDSCVEFFFQPQPSTYKGYYNLEMSISGAHLIYYVRDWTRTEHGFLDYSALPAEDGLKIQTISSNPGAISPEETGEKEWFMFFSIPVSMLEKFHGPIGALSGQVWQGNFYKCADDLKEPHWLAWNPVAPLNFHLPNCFGEFRFE